MRTSHYSDFLTRFAALLGVQPSDLDTGEQAQVGAYFTRGMKYIWQCRSWIDLCPFGEYRVPNNSFTFCHDFENTSWIRSYVTVTPNFVANPVDVQSNADLVLETNATGVHGISQPVTYFNTQYAVSIFAQAAGRNFIQLTATDSASNVFSAIFNIAGTNGATVISFSNCTAVINQISGLWYQATINFTPLAVGPGTAGCNLSSDGTTTSYTGNPNLGVYAWGASVIPTTPSGISQQLIPWTVPGESDIDVVYDVFNSTPLATSYPSRIGYKMTNNGVQIINSTNGWNAMYYVQSPQTATSTTSLSPLSPVYLHYRQRCPNYSGSPYDPTQAYGYGQQIYFTSATNELSPGLTSGDFYKCVLATTAGQSPDTSPSNWSVLEVPYAFVDYCAYSALADWYRAEGQTTKAQAQDQLAEGFRMDEIDREELQMGSVQPWRVYTHLTSRPNFTR